MRSHRVLCFIFSIPGLLSLGLLAVALHLAANYFSGLESSSSSSGNVVSKPKLGGPILDGFINANVAELRETTEQLQALVNEFYVAPDPSKELLDETNRAVREFNQWVHTETLDVQSLNNEVALLTRQMSDLNGQILAADEKLAAALRESDGFKTDESEQLRIDRNRIVRKRNELGDAFAEMDGTYVRAVEDFNANRESKLKALDARKVEMSGKIETYFDWHNDPANGWNLAMQVNELLGQLAARKSESLDEVLEMRKQLMDWARNNPSFASLTLTDATVPFESAKMSLPIHLAVEPLSQQITLPQSIIDMLDLKKKVPNSDMYLLPSIRFGEEFEVTNVEVRPLSRDGVLVGVDGVLGWSCLKKLEYRTETRDESANGKKFRRTELVIEKVKL